MFEVTYCDFSDKITTTKVDVVQFLHLLELFATEISFKALSVSCQGKPIDCDRLLRSLKFT